MDVDMAVVPLTAEHWDEVAVIYADGIATGQATFETVVPAWAEWDAGHLQVARLAALSPGPVGAGGADGAGALAGWAALSPVSRRAVYAGVAEVSVYVAARHRGRRIGSRLLARLVEESEAAGIWTLQASIFPENEATLRLHGGAGFRVVGRRERIGCQHGVWRDTLLLERRSAVAGRE